MPSRSPYVDQIEEKKCNCPVSTSVSWGETATEFGSRVVRVANGNSLIGQQGVSEMNYKNKYIFNHSHFYFFLTIFSTHVCVCVCVYTNVHTPWSDDLRKSVLSFHHLCPEDWVHVVWLGGKRLCLLNLFANPLKPDCVPGSLWENSLSEKQWLHMAFQKTSHLEPIPTERNCVRIKFPSTCLLLRQLCDQLASLYSPSLYNVSVMVSNHTLPIFPSYPMLRREYSLSFLVLWKSRFCLCRGNWLVCS